MEAVILALANNNPIILILGLIIVSGVVLTILFILKTMLLKGRIGLKVGSNEVNLGGGKDDDKGENSPPSNVGTYPPVSNLTSTISQIVTCGVDTGIRKSERRHELFVTQMSYTWTEMTLIIAMMTYNLSERVKDTPQWVLDYILRRILEASLIFKLKEIFRQDHLTEMPKEDVVNDGMKSLKNLEITAINEFRKIPGINKMVSEKDIEYVFTQAKESLSFAIRNSLERGYEEDVKYISDLKNLEEKMSSKINEIITMSYPNFDPNTLSNKIWDSTMPNDNINPKVEVSHEY